MSLRLLRSAGLSVSLGIALLVSLLAHALRGGGSASREACRVVVVEAVGGSTQPEIRVDFDAPLALPADPNATLGAEYLSLEPAAPVDVRAAGARRLAVVPRRALAPFTTYRLRLGARLAATDGRPVVAEGGASLAFESGVFGLADDPRTRVDDDGSAVVVLRLTGPVAEGSLAEHVRLLDAAGGVIPTTLTGDGVEWSLSCGAPLRAPAESSSAPAARPVSTPLGSATLELRQGLRSTAGGNGLAATTRRELRWSDTLVCEGASASFHADVGEIRVSFDRTLDEATAADLVVASPSPAGLVRRVWGSLVLLQGAFVPGTTVAVTARAGLRATSGLRLPKDARRLVRIPAPEPELSFVGKGAVLSSEAIPTLEMTGVNVAEVLVEARRVFPGNVVPLALRWASERDAVGEAISTRIEIDAPPHATWRRPLDLAALLGGRDAASRRGVWSLRIADPRSRWVSDDRLLEITDLATVVRHHPDGLAVFVSRISDGSAVPGAKVVAWTAANQVATEGVTDRDGLLVVRGLARVPRVVTVTTPDDAAFVDLLAHGLSHDARDVEGRPVASGPEAWVRADRGLVRPGESVHVDALVRLPTGEAPAEGLPVRLRLRGPDGRVARTLERRAGLGGLVDAEFPIAVEAPTGACRVEAEVPGLEKAVGAGAFRVEAFVADRLEASVAWPEGDLALGTRVPAAIRARFLTGDPAAGLSVRARLVLEPRDRVPVEGFAFGDAGAPAPRADERAHEAVLDAKGEATLEIPLPPAGASGLARRATVEVEVIDVSGRAVGAAVSRDALPSGPRLGLRVADEAKGEGAGAAGLAFDVVVAGGDVRKARASLARVEWVGAYVQDRRARTWHSTRTETVLEQVPVTLKGGRSRVAFRGPGDGTFVVRVSADGAAGAALEIERRGGTATPSTRGDGAPRLALAREGVARPGGRAAIVVEAPFAGRALLSVEGARVFEARTVDLPAGRSRLAFDVPETAWPSVHATVTLVRGAKGAGPGAVRLLGAVAIPVERADRRVEVTLDADPVTLPEAPLEVRVTTSEPSEVVLHLVDEGVLRKSRHGDPDPARHFAAVRRLMTSPADAYARLVEGARFASDDPDPGGDGPEGVGSRLDPTARNLIETVALASRRVLVDGSTVVRFDVPAYEGRLRLCAVAAGRRGTGAAARDVVVRGPIGLAIHLPRAVAPGDEFDAAVEVRGADVSTAVELDGFERRGEGFPLRLVALERLGVGTVTVRASDAAGHALVRTARLSIRPASPRTTDSLVLDVAAADAATRDLPGRLLPSSRTARVTVGLGPLVELLPAFERLSEYPYGCIEQTTSKAFPVLAWSAIATLSMPDGGRPDDVVDAAIERLFTMQTSSGGFSAWPGGRESNAFGTLYATHFLVEAKRFGRAVPEDRLAAALDAVSKDFRDGARSGYAAYVLALGGRDVAAELDAVRFGDDLEDRAHVAAAWFALGDRARAQELLAGIGDPFLVKRESGGDLTSPVRAAAVLLEALADVNPSDPRADALEGRLRASARAARESWTTQESAAALLATARRHAKAREVGVEAHGTLRVGSRAVTFDGPEGATLELAPGDPWTFSVDASAPVTVAVRVAGIPVDAPTVDVAHGMTITRTIEGAEDGFVQGRVYRVALAGTVPSGTENLLLSDVLPGGLEIEEARETSGDWGGDRVEVRDDRVLWFRTRACLAGTFRQTYLVRAVTPGRFRVPPASVEALYDPTLCARAGGGAVLEVRRGR